MGMTRTSEPRDTKRKGKTMNATLKFAKGQKVRGVKAGDFEVVSSKWSDIHNCEVVTLVEIHPVYGKGSKFKLPADCIVHA